MPELTQKQLDLLRYIRNSIAHGGSAPSVRDVMRMLGYKSPHSAMLALNELIEMGVLNRNKRTRELNIRRHPESGYEHARTVEVPLVGSAPCGQPLLAEQNIEMLVSISIKLAKPPHKYFLLRAVGDSMNRSGISSGDLVLVRQQPDAENGEIIVALIDDHATIKTIHRGSGTIILKPHSSNKDHKPIVLTDDFQIQGKVVATIPSI